MKMKNAQIVKTASPPIRPLEESLPIQLLKVHDQVMAYFRPMLNRYGMSDQQWRVMRAIAAGVTDFKDLSQATHIQPASLSRMLITLQDRGWTTRVVSSTDRRQRIITLTDDGWALFHEAAAETEAKYAELQGKLGDCHADILTSLRSVSQALE